MNTELTLQWVKNVIGAFLLKRRLLACDLYQYHTENTLKKSLATKKIDPVIVSDGCTKYLQAHDFSWKKSFKFNYTDKYDD